MITKGGSYIRRNGELVRTGGTEEKEQAAAMAADSAFSPPSEPAPTPGDIPETDEKPARAGRKGA